MTSKDVAHNMVEPFAEYKDIKNIDKTIIISVHEESFK